MRTGPEMTRRTLVLWLAPMSGACLGIPVRAESLEPRLSGNNLKIAAPRFRFVTGKPLERLHDGAPVPFAIQLSLLTDRTAGPAFRDIQRFVISYDLWEEKFAVVKLGARRKSASHLTATAAEAWCIDEMALQPAGLGEQQPFWIRLEVRAEDPSRDVAANDEPMSLARLIDLFSRRTRGEERRWSAEAGPFRLAQLRQTQGQQGSARFPAPRSAT